MFCIARDSLPYLLLHGVVAWMVVGAVAGCFVGWVLWGRRA